MSEILSIAQNNYILQGTVATSAGIVGDGTTQNPLRIDETVLWSGYSNTTGALALSANADEFQYIEVYGDAGAGWSDHARPQLYGKCEGIYNTGEKLFAIQGCNRVSNGNLQTRIIPISINGSTATINQSIQVNINTAGAVTRENTNCAVTRIVGINKITNG